MVSFLRELTYRTVRKPGYKLLSFLIAVLAWWYVQSNNPTEEKIRVEIDWTMPKGLMTVEAMPSSTYITIEGTRTAVRKTREQRDILLFADLSQYGIGKHSIEFSKVNVRGLPTGVQVEGFSPANVPFTVDEVWTKNVKVKAEQVGEPGTGYEVIGVFLNPNVVEIQGPRARVEELVEVETAPIKVSGLTIHKQLPVQLNLPRSISLVNDVDISALITVEPLVETRSFGAIPVHVWKHKDWQTTQETVAITLEGPAAALRELKVDDIVAFVHLPEEPAKMSYEAPFGPDEGLRLRVLHGGTAAVKAVKVNPPRVEVHRE
ncbi:MAG: hypothetical protein HN348_15260 [Proteobacteria bacterium]|nr:hypothetical protein [Pseudomonadota bacterium]